MTNQIKIGISSCLLGNNVRYDGGHTLDRFLRNTLGQYVEYVPVCPEAECGLGVPREVMRLEGTPENPDMVTINTRKSITEKMKTWAAKRISRLKNEELCGYIFKSRSPSCGIKKVKVFNEKGKPVPKGSGLFARAFTENFPLIPVEDEETIHDHEIRENFIERIFILKRWRDTIKGKKSAGKLVKFHSENKLILFAHSEKHYRLMGKIVAGAGKEKTGEAFRNYEQTMLEALNLKATPNKHINVLMHMMGYFKKQLSTDEKQELLKMLDEYKKGLIPLIAPVTLINHYAIKYDEPYLKAQTYLNPHPVELMLRNHV